jgi:glycosyltransferase involved in cell wall biosynthesis
MLSNVPDDDLISLYAASDCVVIPSRMESIPVVFSEALAFDKGMIVSDVGDLGLLGREYGVAQVVPPENPAALKEAMKERLRGKVRRQGEGGKRAELKNLFNVERSVERFLADYS